MSSSLDVFLLGALELDSAIELQERMRDEIAGRNDRHGVLLVCEHPPAITIGREGRFADVLIDRDELVSRRIDVRWVNRGGGTFLHLPGQLAINAIVPLERLALGLTGLRSAFEASLIAMAGDLKVPAERSTAAPGAVCRCGQFAFIGAGVRDWVSYGGMLVNVSLPQEILDLVRWTDTDVRVTSLSAQRTRPTAVSTVRESLIRNLSQAMGYDSYHLFTGHPLLHRTTRKVYVYA
ncbi:lipoyl protein ligase domain-containing protein [Schlesneria paludicola]|uniref:lipoyl protein ligase domain-containing protein n=1 Tax=Schlesneria paludicola TaxID=360056 RepID=UPI0012FC4C2A|nr:hypothetical protein [Schlesneria paludicola]